MWKSLKKYNATLLHKGAISEGAMRYHEMREIAYPWMLLMVAMVGCGFGMELLVGPNASVRTAIVVLIGVPSLLGMTHATSTYLFGAIRADICRRRSR